MRTKKTIETVTCDVCHEECKPVVDIAMAGIQTGRHDKNMTLQFHFDARLEEDICEECLRNIIKTGPIFFTTETE